MNVEKMQRLIDEYSSGSYITFTVKSGMNIDYEITAIYGKFGQIAGINTKYLDFYGKGKKHSLSLVEDKIHEMIESMYKVCYPIEKELEEKLEKLGF
jgi:hypothetical protein